jgi:hypothetical protein
LSGLRDRKDRNHAYRRVPILLRLHRLRHAAAAEARTLLRFLFLWFGAVPVGSGRAVGKKHPELLLSRRAAAEIIGARPIKRRKEFADAGLVGMSVGSAGLL